MEHDPPIQTDLEAHIHTERLVAYIWGAMLQLESMDPDAAYRLEVLMKRFREEKFTERQHH